MIHVHLFVQSRYPVNRFKIRDTVERILRENHVENAQLDVSIVGDRKIKQLNESKLQHEGTTDVLSFPQHERHKFGDFPLPPGVPPHLGDIVVCFPEAVRHARRFGKLVDDQLCFFVEHGVMHLLGYHHGEEVE